MLLITIFEGLPKFHENQRSDWRLSEIVNISYSYDFDGETFLTLTAN